MSYDMARFFYYDSVLHDNYMMDEDFYPHEIGAILHNTRSGGYLAVLYEPEQQLEFDMHEDALQWLVDTYLEYEQNEQFSCSH